MPSPIIGTITVTINGQQYTGECHLTPVNTINNPFHVNNTTNLDLFSTANSISSQATPIRDIASQEKKSQENEDREIDRLEKVLKKQEKEKRKEKKRLAEKEDERKRKQREKQQKYREKKRREAVEELESRAQREIEAADRHHATHSGVPFTGN